MSAPAASLVILSQPSCVQCGSTYRALDKRGIPYRSYNVSDEADLANGGQEFHDVAKELGYMQAPVGLALDEDGKVVDSWSGFRPDKIAEHGPAVRAAVTGPLLELAAA